MYSNTPPPKNVPDFKSRVSPGKALVSKKHKSVSQDIDCTERCLGDPD